MSWREYTPVSKIMCHTPVYEHLMCHTPVSEIICHTPVSETEQSVPMLDLLMLSSCVDLDISQSFRCKFTFRKSKLT